MRRLHNPTTIASALLLAIVLNSLGGEQTLTSDSADSWARICSEAAPAVISLYSAGRGSQAATSRGTGFLISADGILITARHVSEGNDELFAFTEDGQKYHVTGFYGEDRDYDVAVLKIQGDHFPHLALAEASTPRSNQWVTVLSREGDGSLISSNGTVSQVAGFPNVWEIIATTIPMHPGQSGSPLLDERGKVVGVISCTGSGSQQYGASMPIGVAKRILQRTGAREPIPFAKRPRKGSPAPLVLDPDFRAVLPFVGKRDWAESERRMKLVTRRFPESPVPVAMLGTFYAQQQSWKAAEAAFAKAVGLNPDFAYAWLMSGLSACSRGRFADAEKALRKSTELQLGDKDLVGLAWQMLAMISAERGSTNGIREALDNLDRVDPKRAGSIYNDIRRSHPKLDLPIDRKQGD